MCQLLPVLASLTETKVWADSRATPMSQASRECAGAPRQISFEQFEWSRSKLPPKEAKATAMAEHVVHSASMQVDEVDEFANVTVASRIEGLLRSTDTGLVFIAEHLPIQHQMAKYSALPFKQVWRNFWAPAGRSPKADRGTWGGIEVRTCNNRSRVRMEPVASQPRRSASVERGRVPWHWQS
jgi:hypothetical protein